MAATIKNPIIVALDVPSAEAALKLAAQVAPAVGAFKIGKELFVSAGPDIVKRVRDLVPEFFPTEPLDAASGKPYPWSEAAHCFYAAGPNGQHSPRPTPQSRLAANPDTPAGCYGRRNRAVPAEPARTPIR